tara:strand:- start:1411 stop:2025 length:615 start_codon:yes stop_codon:yes gene_type:complete
MEKTNLSKWFALGVGGILGISHIGMIGLLTTRNTSKLPDLNIPTGDYATYEAEVGEDGYRIRYRANDPKTMYITKDIKTKGGFLGLSNNTKKVVEEYTMDGATHHGGPVSTKSAWIDPAALAYTGGTADAEGKLSAKTEACIKAVGGGEQSGRLVGTSVGAAAAPALSGIPFVGWVAAGWVAMFGGNQGAEIGGNMAQEMSKDC